MMMFRTDQFTNVGKENGATILVTEASSLPVGFGREFGLKSTRTKRVVRFVLCRTVKDRDGDVTLWDFAPADNVKDAPPVRVYVYND